MKAIVMAAGTGSRLGEITKTRTKGMVPVGGKRLIDHLLDFFDLEMFDHVFVVGGFYYGDLKAHVDARGLTNVTVLENPDFLKGNIFTLKTGLRQFDDDSFLLTNVDHIYPRALFNRMKGSFSGITAMCDFDRNLTDDDMKVKLRGNQTIEFIRKDLKDFDCGYIGMTYVDRSMQRVYRDMVEKTVAQYGEKAVAENVLQMLSGDAATAPGICDLSGIGWYEVDNETDLRAAEKGLLDNPNFKR